jgi:hypothetical protein
MDRRVLLSGHQRTGMLDSTVIGGVFDYVSNHCAQRHHARMGRVDTDRYGGHGT